jgi:uncharacterized membrane protein
MKKNILVKITILFVIIASFAMSAFFYPLLPNQMASHWNIKGDVDGYLSKFWALFLMPIISLILFLFFILIPKIDPLRENIGKFIKYYHGFIIVLILFLYYLYYVTLILNIGFKFNIIQLLAPAFAGFFYYIGILMENLKRNWFIGIRTPWTLSSDKVWLKTHKVGGKLYKYCAAFSILGIYLFNYAIYLIVLPIILISLYLVVFSYFEYKKEEKKPRRIKK